VRFYVISLQRNLQESEVFNGWEVRPPACHMIKVSCEGLLHLTEIRQLQRRSLQESEISNGWQIRPSACHKSVNMRVYVILPKYDNSTKEVYKNLMGDKSGRQHDIKVSHYKVSCENVHHSGPPKKFHEPLPTCLRAQGRNPISSRSLIVRVLIL
jgi:hypothetical protein